MAGASFPSGVSNMSHISSGSVVQIGSGRGRQRPFRGRGHRTGCGNGHLPDRGRGTRVCPWKTSGSPPPIRALPLWTRAPLAAGSRSGPGMPPAGRQEVREQTLPIRGRQAGGQSVTTWWPRTGCIFVKGSPDRGMTLKEAIKGYQYADLAHAHRGPVRLVCRRLPNPPPFSRKTGTSPPTTPS